jgi:hypothetical protein
MFNKSSLFLIFLVIVPIALSSDLFAKLEKTQEGKSILNTLMIQTKLNGVNSADSIKTVLNNSQKNNDSGLEKFEARAKVEKEACESDLKSLKESLNENISKKYAIEKTADSTELLKGRKADYSKELQAEIEGFENYEKEITESQKAWTDFYESMRNSIKAAEDNLGKIKELVNAHDPREVASTSFAQIKNKESAIAEIKSNLEYRYYDTLGMKPILTNLLQVVAKGISAPQYHKIMKTIDMIENFLADRKNNLIEDNEYQAQYSSNLVNSIKDSAASTKNEKDIVDGLVSSLETRLGLLRTSRANSAKLVEYARSVHDARERICQNFEDTYYAHLRRYNNVRLAIAELSNAFDDEYKEFTGFIQRKMIEKN